MKLGYPVLPLPSGCPWSDYRPPEIKYCEENLCAWITAPANTWSNLAYIAVALWLWRSLSRKYAGPILLFVAAAFVTGIGSFLYHASYTFAFQVLDFVGMFMFSALLLVLNLRRVGWVSRAMTIPFYVTLVAVGTVLLVFADGSLGRSVFGIEILAAGVIELYLFRKLKRDLTPISYRWLWATFAVFTVAYTAWWIDTGNFWCDPSNHFIQGHAVWHVVNAFCFITAANFYGQFKEVALRN